MTKEQINYLLGLATVVVIWLFFNTFYMTARIEKRMLAFNERPAVSAMKPWPDTGFSQAPRPAGNRAPTSYLPGSHRNYKQPIVSTNFPGGLPAEIQKLNEAAKAAPSSSAPAASEKKA